jgi:hypothetical protein
MITSVQPGWLADGSLPARRKINMAPRGKDTTGGQNASCRVVE